MKKIVLGLMLLGSVMFGESGEDVFTDNDKRLVKNYYNKYVPLLLNCESKYFENASLNFNDMEAMVVFFAKVQRFCYQYVATEYKMNFRKDFELKNWEHIGLFLKMCDEMLNETRKEFMQLYPIFPAIYSRLGYIGYLYKNDDEVRESFKIYILDKLELNKE